MDVAAWLRSFRPVGQRYRGADVARGALGAVVGIAAAALTADLVGLGPSGLPFIVAPMGATAVLLFAAPASPLAQPWAVVGGNISATLVGAAAARVVSSTALAAALAVGAAIALMMLLRCVHPPGGACALFAAVGAGPVREQGFLFAVFPVAIDTLVLLAVAIAVNNLTGRRYPHVAPAPAAPAGADASARERAGVGTDDIARAMARLDQGLDVLPGDVLALVRDAEAHALDRRLGGLAVGSVMARDVLSVQAFETVFRIRMIFEQHHVKAVPVVDDHRRSVGIVTIYDLFHQPLASVVPASEVMSSPVTTIDADAPTSALIELMTDRGLRHVPVVDADGVLVGIATRTELIAVLHRALLGDRRADG